MDQVSPENNTSDGHVDSALFRDLWEAEKVSSRYNPRVKQAWSVD